MEAAQGRLNYFVKFVSTCGYAGYIKGAPGTYGSILGLVFAAFFTYYVHDVVIFSLVTMFLSAAGIYITSLAETHVFFKKDPPQIVFDEFCGICVSVMIIPFNFNLQSFVLYISAFALFRYLDIKKPLFINRLQSLPSGAGIMLDDLAAGFITLAGVISIKVVIELIF